MARAWGIHPDQLLDTTGRTYRLMLEQLATEAERHSHGG